MDLEKRLARALAAGDREDRQEPHCGKRGCKAPILGATQACPSCIGKRYGFCVVHGGEAAARRSLKSHMGLYHPRAR